MLFKRFRPHSFQSWHCPHIPDSHWQMSTNGLTWTLTRIPLAAARNLRRNSLPKMSLEVDSQHPHISTVPASGWSSTTEVPPCLAMCPPPASALRSPAVSGSGETSIPSLVDPQARLLRALESVSYYRTMWPTHIPRRSGELRQFSCTCSHSTGPKFLFSSQLQHPQAVRALEAGLHTPYFWS